MSGCLKEKKNEEVKNSRVRRKVGINKVAAFYWHDPRRRIRSLSKTVLTNDLVGRSPSCTFIPSFIYTNRARKIPNEYFEVSFQKIDERTSRRRSSMIKFE